MPDQDAMALTTKVGALTVTAHRGVGAVLLAFSIDDAAVENLAGFAIDRTAPGGTPKPLNNRISFDQQVTASTTPEQRRWINSHDAPFQKFRWVDVPPDSDLKSGAYTYTVTARYFTGPGNDLKDGPVASIRVPLLVQDWSGFQLGFTRGDLSSQAYADRFHNADYRARPKTLDFDTALFEAQYEWLGFTGRKLLFEFLKECVEDTECTVDLFAYDLDEPDVLKQLEALGGRLRAFLDDASLHTKAGALEPEAKSRLIASAGATNVESGHFQRFSHCKVLIKKDSTGKAQKVLAGSANFSVRGLYAQANNVFVYDDPTVAGLYEQAFEQAFGHPKGEFAGSQIAAGWKDAADSAIPASSFCFSPHTDHGISLDRVKNAIDGAGASVLFAIMQLVKGGEVTSALAQAATRPDVFSYGVVDSNSDAIVFGPSAPNGMIVPFDFLKDHVPPPFQAEFGRDASGGIGPIIHDKFVVVDFNGPNPAVFFGSSNLADGGEEANGDSLVTTREPAIVSAFAVEAIRLIDHFHFRAAMHNATDVKPLTLADNAVGWWKPYYDPTNLKNTERVSLVAVTPPAADT